MEGSTERDKLAYIETNFGYNEAKIHELLTVYSLILQKEFTLKDFLANAKSEQQFAEFIQTYETYADKLHKNATKVGVDIKQLYNICVQTDTNVIQSLEFNTQKLLLLKKKAEQKFEMEELGRTMGESLRAINSGINTLNTLAATKELKQQVTKFDGSANEKLFARWLSDMQRLRSLHSLSDADMRLISIASITGIAADYLASMIRETPEITWINLQTNMKSQFSNLNDEDAARNRLKLVKQEKDDSLAVFGQKLLTLADMAFSQAERRQGLAEKILVSRFYEGLQSDYLAKVLMKRKVHHHTLQDAITDAINIGRDDYAWRETRGITSTHPPQPTIEPANNGTDTYGRTVEDMDLTYLQSKIKDSANSKKTQKIKKSNKIYEIMDCLQGQQNEIAKTQETTVNKLDQITDRIDELSLQKTDNSSDDEPPISTSSSDESSDEESALSETDISYIHQKNKFKPYKKTTRCDWGWTQKSCLEQ